MRLGGLIICVFLGLVAKVYGQSDTLKHEALQLEFTHPDTIGVGDTLLFQLEIQVLRGWHVYSAHPINRQSGMTPLEMKFVDLPKWIVPVGKPVYPAGISYEGSRVYLGGGHVIEQRFTITSDAPFGNHTIAGQLIYQGCDANVCFPPIELPFSRLIHTLK